MERQPHIKNEKPPDKTAAPVIDKLTDSVSQKLHPVLRIRTVLGNQSTGRWLQAKLNLSHPGDAYEQEADRVAEQVMRMPDQTIPATVQPGGLPQLSRLPRKCAPCAEEEIQRQPMTEEEEEEETLQTKEAAGQTPEIGPSAQARINSLRGAWLHYGQPLPASARAFFEPRFGYDFSQVRVHTNAEAVESARAVRSLAYTVGRNVVFGEGQYAPETAAGQQLLAHELAHVAQQSQAAPVAPAALEIAPPGSSPEQEAEAASQSALRGQAAPLAGTTRKLARQVLQRAEHGTYVSRLGDQTFLDAGFAFYTNWGHPNVRRVSTIDDVLTDLDRGRGQLDTFRIVAHANPSELLIGLMPSLSPTLLDNTALEFGAAERFRTRLAEIRLISSQAFANIWDILRNDATTSPAMVTLGIDTTAPEESSPLGLVLRALMEARFVADVQLDTGGAPAIVDRAIINEFNRRRLDAFRQTVRAGFPAGQRQAVTRAIADLAAQLPGALRRANFSFTPITQAEADTLADPVKEARPSGGGHQLQREISTLISEGAGSGAFLGRLERVRSRITTGTHIEIRGCEIGQNPDFLDAFRNFMGGNGNLPGISAPDLFQFYFPLNFETVPATPTGDAALDAAFNNPLTGLARDFELQTRIRRAEMIPVSREESPDDFIQRYGLAARGMDLAALRRLNPDLPNAAMLSLGTTIFLKARQVPAGSATSFEDIARQYFGDQHAWTKVWGFNPHITTPNLSPNDLVWLQSAQDRSQFGVVTAPVGLPELRAAIRAGEAVASIEETPQATTQPRLRVDDPQRAAALGRWLAAQRFDPRGRTAQALSRLFAANFGATAMRLHMNFLSRSFPQVEDPIFPDDPRFQAHIIRRP